MRMKNMNIGNKNVMRYEYILRTVHFMHIKCYVKKGTFEFQSHSRSNIFHLKISSTCENISTAFNHGFNENHSSIRVTFLRFLNMKVMCYRQALKSAQIKRKKKTPLGNDFSQ